MKKILPMVLILLALITVVMLSGCASAEVRAVRSGDIEGIREYINSGGDVNAPQRGGVSLLMLAAENPNRTAIEEVLIAAGAPPPVQPEAPVSTEQPPAAQPAAPQQPVAIAPAPPCTDGAAAHNTTACY